VVFGFYPRGFFRLFTRFRFYAKPYFVFDESGDLEIENLPVLSPDELYALYDAGTRRIGGWDYSYLIGTIGKPFARTLERTRINDRNDPSWRLMAAVLKRFRDQALKAGSLPFLLIFPVRPQTYEDSVYEDLDRMAQEEAQSLGIPFLALTKPFFAKLDDGKMNPLFRELEAGGHLSAEGNRLVAALLYRSLQEEGYVAQRVHGGEQSDDAA
jgi:hypothetical protein